MVEKSHEAGWHDIASAPIGRDLEISVIERDGAHALNFPCRRAPGGWLKAGTREMVDVRPTHWRIWPRS